MLKNTLVVLNIRIRHKGNNKVPPNLYKTYLYVEE